MSIDYDSIIPFLLHVLLKTFPVKRFYIGDNKAHFLPNSSILVAIKQTSCQTVLLFEIQNGSNTALLVKLCFMHTNGWAVPLMRPRTIL